MNSAGLHLLLALVLMGFICSRTLSQQQSPAGSGHYNRVNKRGHTAMGFSHGTTTHHFLLFSDGGAIRIGANNSSDSASKEAIRNHVAMTARMFSDGDFQLPLFIHATTPPGVETMKRLKNEISYRAERPKRLQGSVSG